jgi:hypothetical protein
VFNRYYKSSRNTPSRTWPPKSALIVGDQDPQFVAFLDRHPHSPNAFNPMLCAVTSAIEHEAQRYKTDFVFRRLGVNLGRRLPFTR